MAPTNHDPRPAPDELPDRAARLMAYLDGELPPEEQARVAAWIAQDPDAHHQHEEERRRRELFASASPPEPGPQAWVRALAGIEKALFAPPGARPFLRRSSTLWALVGVTAAAVLAAVWIRTSGLFAPPQPIDTPRTPVDVLAVATADDVTIDDMDPADARLLVVGEVPGHVSTELRAMSPFAVSTADEISVETMNGDDTDRLVVGEPPVSGPLVMAEPGDVKEVQIDGVRAKGQPKPYLFEPPGNGGMPMINISLKTVRKD